jgi:hypothetical protein
MIISLPLGLIIGLRSKWSVDFNDALLFMFGASVAFIQVGRNTALSLAKRSTRLHSLDLSWCRNMSDEAVGLIVDNCLSLRVLKLFGCTQVYPFLESSPG